MREVADVSVRPATADDAPAIQAIYAPYVSDSVTSFEEAPPSADDICRRITAEPCLPWFVAARQASIVGYAYAGPYRARPAYRWTVESSVYLAPDERGRGTGRVLYERLLEELHTLGYVTVVAGITLPNEASVRLHEAMGFTPIGVYRHVGFKFGGWHDVGWWERPLRDPPLDPPDPSPWASEEQPISAG